VFREEIAIMFQRPSSRCRILPLLIALTGGSQMMLAQESAQPGLAAFEGIGVSAADRNDVSRLTDAGVVTIAVPGGGMVVTLAGELRSRADREGTIGLLLLPDVPFFNSLYRNKRIVLAAGEVTVPIGAGDSSYFMAKPKRIEPGFTRYRLLLFNTTGAVVSANVYVNSTRD
jgi:hypothetical protein